MFTPRRFLTYVIAFILLLLLIAFSVRRPLDPTSLHDSVNTHAYQADIELVVASLEREDTSWIPQYLPDWKTYIYVADDPRAPFTVPKNKGREAMVYLTHIINFYSHLPQKVSYTRRPNTVGLMALVFAHKG